MSMNIVIPQRTASWAFALLGMALAASLLSGCKSLSADTAREVMQQQAQEQAAARQQMEEAERKRVSKPEIELSLIRKMQEEGRYFASLAYLEAYRQQYGDSAESAALRAEAQRKTGQDEASEQTYRSLVSGKGPEVALGWHGLGLLAGTHSNYAQAAEYLGKAAALRPVDAEYLGDWGYALLRSGKPKAARVPLGQAAELAPDNQRILGNVAVLLLVEGDTAGAEQVMTRAKLSPQAREQVLQLAAQTKVVMVPSSPFAPSSPATAINTPKSTVVTATTATAPDAQSKASTTAKSTTVQSSVMPMSVLHGTLMQRYANDASAQQ